MFAATRLNNLQILDELEKLTARFSQQGIPVVALKGICFALTIYPDIGMRPMVDLDLLVPASRLAEAIQIAYDLGYEKAVPEATPGLDELLNHAACLAKTAARSLHSRSITRWWARNLFSMPSQWTGFGRRRSLCAGFYGMESR